MIEEPEWMKILKPDALVSAKDLSNIFGVSQNALKQRASRGSFPMWEKTLDGINVDNQRKQKFLVPLIPKGSRTQKAYWKVGTIREWIKEHTK